MAREERIIRLSMAGKSLSEIARLESASMSSIKVTLREIALRARMNLADRVAQAQLEQHTRVRSRMAELDAVIAKATRLLLAPDAPLDVDTIAALDKMLRTSIALMEREAKLLGLDVPRPGLGGEEAAATGSMVSWIERAKPDELLEYAKQFRLRTPEPFQT